MYGNWGVMLEMREPLPVEDGTRGKPPRGSPLLRTQSPPPPSPPPPPPAAAAAAAAPSAPSAPTAPVKNYNSTVGELDTGSSFKSLLALSPKKRAETVLSEINDLTEKVVNLVKTSGLGLKPSGASPEGGGDFGTNVVGDDSAARGEGCTSLPQKRGIDELSDPGSGLDQCSDLVPRTKEILEKMASYQDLLVPTLKELADVDEPSEECSKALGSQAVQNLSALRDFGLLLQGVERVLESSLEEFAAYKRPSLKRRGVKLSQDDSRMVFEAPPKQDLIDVQDLIAYAHKISYSTFAPPEFASGQVPLRGFQPPAPQDEHLRASQLYLVKDVDLGIPPEPIPKDEEEEEEEEEDEEVMEEEEEAAVGKLVTPLGTEELAPDTMPNIPPNLPPGIGPVVPPPGWRPGMPVELPKDLLSGLPGLPGLPGLLGLPSGLELPPMPSGWKPGDPVPINLLRPLSPVISPEAAVIVPYPAVAEEPVVTSPAPSTATPTTARPVARLTPPTGVPSSTAPQQLHPPTAISAAPVPPVPQPCPPPATAAAQLPPAPPAMPITEAGVTHVPWVEIDLNPELSNSASSEPYSDEDDDEDDD